MVTLAFRADGSQNIGMGHIMRCLSLAKEFRQNGHKVYFISKFECEIDTIKEQNFEVIQIKNHEIKKSTGISYGKVKEFETETKEVIDIVKRYKIELLFIDTYNVTEKYFLEIKQHVNKLAYIDDLNKFIYPVDIVINGNITGEYMNYKSYFGNQRFLLGPKYNLIREEFKNISKCKVRERIKKIFITTGGSDSYSVTEKIIDMIRSETCFDEIELHVIIGIGFNNKKEIKERHDKYKNIIIYENVNKISTVMLECDIAISSCGSTLYELCACGLPTLGFILADNQKLIANKMDEHGYIIKLGWYYDLNREKVINSLKSLSNNFDERKKIVRKQQLLVDGKGTKRIVNEITKILEEKEGGR